MPMPKRYRSYAEEWLRKNVGGAGWKQLIPSLTRLLQSIAPQIPHDPDDRECECTECRQHRDDTRSWKAHGELP